MGRDDMSEARKQLEQTLRKFTVFMFNLILITQTREKLAQSVLLKRIEKKKKKNEKIWIFVLQKKKVKYCWLPIPFQVSFLPGYSIILK